MTVVSRLYDNYSDATRAVSELERAGISHSDISIVANNAEGWYSEDGGAVNRGARADRDGRIDRDRDGRIDRDRDAGSTTAPRAPLRAPASAPRSAARRVSSPASGCWRYRGSVPLWRLAGWPRRRRSPLPAARPAASLAR
jgi:hypothetical protein